jgi:two-component system, NtrC family, response regulator HupR/HoxA
MSKRHAVLVVDDEPANLQKLKRTFWEDFEVIEASDGAAALRVLEKRKVAAIITDQRMPGMSGVELLEKSLALRPEAIRIILTGYTDVEDLMDAINQGHVHRYITKPWDPFTLTETVRRELERWELKRENERLAGELQAANERLAQENVQLRQEVEALRDGEHRLLYSSRAMDDLLRLLARVVKTDSTVLIQGETGTGKELLARHIHERSARADRAFVPVNCGAIPRELIESAFFGHRRGAFTGATEDRKGFFEAADGGTLFLDEVGEAPLELQVKLLRVLQEGEILRVGAQSAERVDVRVIASTNRNLGRLVEDGAFRQDLFFRLNVFSVLVPPLRARPEDVPLLAEHFLASTSRRLNKRVLDFDAETLARLERYDWPGNVRELENEVERLVILCDPDETVGPDLLSDRIRHGPTRTPTDGDLKEQVAALERTLILRALKAHKNNKSRAAEALGITRQTIIAKLKQYENRKLSLQSL